MFKPKDVPSIPGYNDHILTDCKKELEILKMAVESNLGINDLISLMPNLTIILQDNCSGVDVVNMGTKEVDEYSW